MAFQGIALFTLGVFGLASLLYYIYTYNGEQGQTYGSGNSTNANDHNEQRILIARPWNEQSNSKPRRRRKSKSMQKSSRIDNECTVCLLDVKDNRITLPCGHQFHTKCIENWKLHGPIATCNTCPNCRKSYN